MRLLGAAVVILSAWVGPAFGQAADVRSADVASFMGTWPINMVNPAGALETVRIWDVKGVARASVLSGRFPASTATGTMKYPDRLTLTLTRLENAQPGPAVLAVTSG